MSPDKQKDDLVARVERLEKVVFGGADENTYSARSKSGNKKPTIAEIAKGTELKNGQEKVALVVGYLEKVEGRSEIRQSDIKGAWIDGKLQGDYANVLLQRAVKDGLVRNRKNGIYDLSQSGETFFADLMKA
ncbi:hypothetical protein KQH82_08145 [bacterium]|nr:hypothetical protein [bacterium]